MAMKRQNSSRPGGGIGSRVNVEKPVRTGTAARGIAPGAVAQLGASQGNHIADGSSRLPYHGEKYLVGKTPAGGAQPLGNAVAAATKCGPGGSRSMRVAGSQGTQGPVNPGQSRPGADKPVFPGFK
jgi:hypothetical protein